MTCSILSAKQSDANQPAGTLFLCFSRARQPSLYRACQRSVRPSPTLRHAGAAQIRLAIFCVETRMRGWRGPRHSIKLDTAKSSISTTTRASLQHRRRRRREEVWQPRVIADLPDRIPITEAELDILEAHFADLLDELFGARR